jgi:hypothetical protein
MVAQTIPRHVHVFTSKSMFTVFRRPFTSSSRYLSWNSKNSLILLISTIAVAGLGYQAGKIHQKQMRATENLGHNEELLRPKHFKKSFELRSRSSLMGYKVPPYPLNDKGVQELLEAGESMI